VTWTIGGQPGDRRRLHVGGGSGRHRDRNDGAVVTRRQTTDTPTLTAAQFAQLKNIAASLGGDEEQRANFVAAVVAALRKRQSFSDAVTSALSTRTMHLNLCDAAPTTQEKTAMTTRTFRYGDPADDKVLDARVRRGEPTLYDGETLRVPLRMMDSVTKEFADKRRAARQVVDGAGDSGLGLHRPGFRTTGNFAATRDERQQARDEYTAYHYSCIFVLRWARRASAW